MSHDRNAAIGEEADGFPHATAAFELDGAALGFLDDARRIVESMRRALLIGAEGHVDHDERALGTPHHGAAMHDHQLERHRQGRLETMHHHAQAVADQQEIDIFIGNRRGMGVIGRQSDNRLTSLAGGDIGSGEAFLVFVD
jgi:hypothetical protein